jgi:hypothetical protein
VIRQQIAKEVPRHVTQQMAAALHTEIAALQAAQARVEQVLQRRRKQCALLFHSVGELQSLQAEDAAAMVPVVAAAEPADGGPQPMQED